MKPFNILLVKRVTGTIILAEPDKTIQSSEQSKVTLFVIVSYWVCIFCMPGIYKSPNVNNLLAHSLTHHNLSRFH